MINLKKIYLKRKYVSIGEINSINLELIAKSFYSLKNKIEYILLGDAKSIKKYLIKINCRLKINLINDPISFQNFRNDKLNIYDISSSNKHKSFNILSQLKIGNLLASKTGYDFVTMPIDKSVLKLKNTNFIGVTEYLGEINQTNTLMLMQGDRFSIMPITTHINLNNVLKKFEYKIKKFFFILSKLKFDLLKNYKSFVFICINPHCGEKGLLGNEDIIFGKTVKKYFKRKYKMIAADSAFNFIPNKSLYFSMYHDQALIPFKIFNKKSLNRTIGLSYRRLSPSHGTASDIKFKNIADNSSYLRCMLI